MIEQDIADLESKLLVAIDSLNETQLEQARLRRVLFELNESVRQGKHNVARIKLEKEIKTREFWAQRGKI